MVDEKTILFETFEYSPDSGEIRWKISPSQKVKAGSVAGCVGSSGYRQIMFQRRPLQAHRLAWFLMTGCWPTHQIDHRNCVPTDNRWSNLREATQSYNLGNTKGRSAHGKGVTKLPWGKYQAQIKKDHIAYYLGVFSTADEASAAYAAAAKKLYGDFART